jgi:hypothetical protein
VRTILAAHKTLLVHLTGASCINFVGRWFERCADKHARYGVHRSTCHLEAVIACNTELTDERS